MELATLMTCKFNAKREEIFYASQLPNPYFYPLYGLSSLPGHMLGTNVTLSRSYNE